MSKVITTDLFIQRAKGKHGGKYNYSKAIYTGKDALVTIICPTHGEFRQRAGVHYRSGCPDCSGKTLMDTAKFISRARGIHGDKYGYESVRYSTMRDKVTIFCKKHSTYFQQKPDAHLHGHGCPKCGGERTAAAKVKGVEWFIKKATEVHNGKYDYSEVDFDLLYEKVTIICPDHGRFEQTAAKHTYGDGCWKCMRQNLEDGKRLDTADFVTMARAVHGDKYNYSLSDYKGKDYPVEIGCKDHGAFTKIAGKHLYSAQGCPKCSCTSTKPETEVYEFVKEIAPDAEFRNRTMLGGRELDIYVPSKGVAIEYCGNYWHSTKSSVDYGAEIHAAVAENKNKHSDKLKKCEKAGIRLLTVFSDEWEQRGVIVKRIISNAIGANETRLHARKLRVEVFNSKHITDFYEDNHIQGHPNGGVSYCLMDGETIVSAMGFKHITSKRGVRTEDSEWELVRFCSSAVVAGGASKLWAAFLADKNPERVVTYSDNRWFSGDIYKRLGFAMDSVIEPDYSIYHPAWKYRKHKIAFSRKRIPLRIAELGKTEHFDPATDPRTELEMTHILGAGRIYDCGKKRWVWSK